MSTKETKRKKRGRNREERSITTIARVRESFSDESKIPGSQSKLSNEQTPPPIHDQRVREKEERSAGKMQKKCPGILKGPTLRLQK